MLCVTLAGALAAPAGCGGDSNNPGGGGGASAGGADAHSGNGGVSPSAGRGGAARGGAGGTPAGAGGSAQNVAGSSAGTNLGGESNTLAGSDGNGASGAAGAGDDLPGCLDASTYSNLFTIADPAFCVVAVYDAPEAIGPRVLPSWGRHAGPLTFLVDATGGGVTFERWSAPAGATGTLTKQETHVDALLPADTHAGFHALDLPFFGWTALNLFGPGATSKGQIVATKGTSVVQRYALNEPDDFAGVADGDNGRLLYLAQSAIGNPLGNVNGLYQADACVLPTPDLGVGTGCALPGPISGWGDEPGALAIDQQGNAFAINLVFNKKSQLGFGYAAPLVKRGAAPLTGAALFNIAGYTRTAAALTPHGSTPGTLVFQPTNATSSANLDVVAQSYTVTSVVVPGSATPNAFLTLTTPNTALALMADNQDRLWVGVSAATSTTYVVVARKAQ